MLLHKLIARGDYVALEWGRIVVRSHKGNAIPEEWLKGNQSKLMRDICSATGLGIFQYLDYSTGRYGQRLSAGVLLHYANILTGQTSPVFFNAILERTRTSKFGKKGQNLSKGKFSVNKRNTFVKYWERLGLPLPRRLSEFHYSMGKLKGIAIAARVDGKGRIYKASIQANVAYDDLYKAVINSAPITGNSLTKNWQAAGNLLAKSTGKEIAESLVPQGLQSNESACIEKCELSNQESASNAVAITTIEPTISNHISDWMAQMERYHQRRRDNN